jgi:hypothetical protein
VAPCPTGRALYDLVGGDQIDEIQSLPAEGVKRMSLRIQIDQVWRVLLANGWHTIAPDPNEPTDSSFDVDTYEYVAGDDALIGGGPIPGVPTTGFAFTDATGHQLRGPLTAILAVDTTRPAPPSAL